MEKLPFDMKKKLMEELTGKDILNVSATSSAMKKISEEKKYDLLWRKKILEEFGLKYNGKNPVEQYKLLSKVEQMDFYFVTTTDEDGNTSVDRLCLSHEVAIDFVIQEIITRARDHDEILTYNQVMYKLADKDEITYNDETKNIYKVSVDKYINIDEKIRKNNFFEEREQLYRTLFGKDSDGASLNINTVPKKRASGEKDFTAKEFFRQLDIVINSHEEIVPSFNTKLIKDSTLRIFDKWNLSQERKDLLYNYIQNNIFVPDLIDEDD